MLLVDDALRELAEALAVLFGELELVRLQEDRIHADVAEDLAALPVLAAVVGEEDVSELTDQPAAGPARQAGHVLQAHVLVDLLAPPDLLLVLEREPHELRVV